jgi:cold shock CspA family protein
MNGTITSLAAERGFGVITDDAGEEFFFHRSALQSTDFEDLAEGLPVVFEARDHSTGDEPGERRRAVNVRLADDATPAVDNERLPSAKTLS